MSTCRVGSSPGTSGLDIDETTLEGERVVGEVKTTIPVGRDKLGAAQKAGMRKDFAKLRAAEAAHKYFFVTEEQAFDVVRRRHTGDLLGVTLVLLPQGRVAMSTS